MRTPTASARERARAAEAARLRHPTARAAPDGRGPRRPVGRRTGLFLVIFLAVTALTLFGVVMVLSATAAASVSDTDSAWSLFRRHLVWAGTGAVAMLVMLRIDYRRWQRLAPAGLVVSLILLVLVTLPWFGVTANGARRWLGIGPLTFQPSEAAKLALILFVADLLSRPSRPITSVRLTLGPVSIIAGTMILLLMAQPHLGATIIIAVITMAMLLMAGCPFRHLTVTGLIGAGLAGAMVGTSPWRRQRLLGFLDPWADPLGNGYQPLQSLRAIATGGTSGVGLGSGRSKWGFLPYAHTDFIFAVIAEELGMVGTMGVMGLFVVVAGTGLAVALRAPDRFGMLLAIGVTAWIVSQAVLNMGAAMALVPVLGMTLPFLSFGGSSLVVTMAAVGLLLNVARQTR